MIKDFNDYVSEFKDLQNSIEDKKLRKTCDYIINHKDFSVWPGSVCKHHGYKNGLIAHTIEVAHYAEEISFIKFKEQVNKDLLLAACLWHDFAKIYDYRLISKQNLQEKQEFVDFGDSEHLWIKNEYHKRIHHIAGSCSEFTAQARIVGLKDNFIFDMQHCLISHHGFNRDWSLKQPQSLEAVILHHADYLSAAFGALS